MFGYQYQCIIFNHFPFISPLLQLRYYTICRNACELVIFTMNSISGQQRDATNHELPKDHLRSRRTEGHRTEGRLLAEPSLSTQQVLHERVRPRVAPAQSTAKKETRVSETA